MCQQLTEASSCPSLFNQLTLPDHATQLNKVMTLWRGRMPRSYDPISVWADLSAWRQFIYGTITRFIQPMLNNETNPDSPPPAAEILEKMHSEQAWLLNEFAQTARIQHQYRVCIDKLNKHYELPNIQSSDGFVKLMENARCHYAHPSELEKGLAMLNKTNIGLFSVPQKVEFFSLKGQFLTKLGQFDEANRAFSTATQNGMGHADVWAAWGQYNEDLFLTRQEMELGVYALNCYIQASNIYRSAKSRPYIAKIIYLLNLDDAKGSLAESLEPHKSNLPVWYWIFFIPQLLNSMTQRSAPLLKFILLQIAKFHPQALFFNMSTAREEYSILRTLAKQPDGEESDSDVYKQAWDCLSDIADSIKIHMPLFSMSAVIFLDALSNCPKPTPTEELYQLTSMLANESIMLLCNRASRSENLLAAYNFPRLSSCLKLLPPGQAREAFEVDFIHSPPQPARFCFPHAAMAGPL
ncbi:transcription-associated protein 1 [Entomophthora muscae]|uniref:Transcription-associated protein 1 n=1 Tax=Entomophthora muscae TaxID=34485 RepID=A0ACC2UP59_9FUNG|nr:transcription-associated protein 1 [Entomophthora muscae]